MPEPDLESPSARGTRAAADGLSLAWTRWDPPEPRGRVVLVHGYGEHGGRYGGTAAWLNGLGWSVSAQDHRGFGRSGGPRGDGPGLDAFVEDLHGFLAGERLPDRPLVVLGHSFGGLVSLLALAGRPGLADAAVLTSPALVLRPLPRSLRILRRVLLRLAPHLSVDLPNNKDLVCSDPAEVERYWTDPLCHRHISAAFHAGFEEGWNRLLPRAPGLDLPLLVLEAGEDTVADPDAADPFWARVPPAGLTRIRLAGFRHEILHDLRRAEARARLGPWLEARLHPPGTPRTLAPCEDG